MLPPKAVMFIIGLISKVFPNRSLPGSDFCLTFDVTFGDKAWPLTGRNDPFIQEAATIAGLISSVLSTMAMINRSFDSVNVPLKILVGEKEGRVDTDAVKELAKGASSKDIEIVQGAYHQLFQDVPEVTKKVCQSVTEWMLNRG